MKRTKHWLKKTIAMLTLVATVIETGFSSVSVYASVLTKDSSTDAVITSDSDVLTEAGQEDGYLTDDTLKQGDPGEADIMDASGEGDLTEPLDGDVEDETDITITAPAKIEQVEEADGFEDAEEPEEATEKKEPRLSVSDSGISGSGYDRVSIYVDTTNLAKRDKFSIKFTGPDSASYNPVLNDELDKTNDGRYDFEDLEGEDFKVRATSADDVILSYKYNEDGHPVIVAESEPVEKVLKTELLTAVDDSKISAIAGEGYESITIEFDTDDISDKDSFKLFVESEADAKVDGSDANVGIDGLNKDTGSLTIEDLDGEAFKAYVVSDTDAQLETVAEVISVEEGTASIDINSVATKRVYEYEDSKVYVRATLEKADAVPDDAYFCVTPLSEEEAGKYLDALNAGRGEDEALATAENTLLYDISFYADETQSEELEPEEGSVTVSFEFKMDQLTEELDIRESEDIVVTHIKEDGAGLSAEEVADVEASIDSGVVEFTTDSFSVYAINKDNNELKFRPGTARDFKKALGSNVNYGLVANYMNIRGHIETNLATKVLESSASIQSSRNKGGGTGFTFIEEYKEGCRNFALKSNSNTGNNVIYTTKEAAERFNGDMGGTLVDTSSYSKEEIDGIIGALISEAQANSDAMFNEPNSYNFSDFKYDSRVKDQYNDFYTIDLTKYGDGDGTYYINFAPGEFGQWAANPNGLVFVISKNMTVVLNIATVDEINNSTVDLSQNIGFKFGKDGSIVGANSENRDMSERLIYNMPNAKTVNFNGTCDGVFICPQAEVNVNAVSSGWIVADRIPVVGGVEWHNTWEGMPITNTEKKIHNFEVTKLFDGPWPEEGFTFRIESYPGDWENPNVSVDPKVMPSKSEITIYESSPDHKGSFGTVSFDAETIYNQGKALNQRSTEPGYEGGYYMCYMYKITEVIPNPKTPGITYHEDPWFVKLWVNAKEERYGNNIAYKVGVGSKTKRPTDSWCKPEGERPVEFVNTYKPVDFPVDFKGIKKVNGSETNVPDGKFGFTLYNYDRNKTFTTPNQSEKFNVGSNVTFDQIRLNFDQATGYNNSDKSKATEAYYYFMIRETTCASPYKPDGGVYIVKVTAYRNDNEITSATEYYYYSNEAKAKVTSKVDDTLKQAEFKMCKFCFNNTREATGTLKLYGTKILEGKELKDDGTFTFVLKDKDGNVIDSTDKIQNITTKDGESIGAFVFDESNKITYSLNDLDKNGEATFHYSISEVIPDDAKKLEDGKREKDGIIYDDTVYLVTVTVKDNGTETLSVLADPASIESPVEFNNTYKASGKIVFKARKSYAENSRLSSAQSFSFMLSGTGLEVPQIKTVKGRGTVKFDTINYEDLSKAGTYKYVIEEVIPDTAKDYDNPKDTDGKYKRDVDGIIYDARKYNITVEVKDNGKGELVKTVKAAYDNDDPETQELITKVDPDDVTGVFVCPEFTNDYSFDYATTTVKGEKILVGHELKGKRFTFRLAPYDEYTSKAIENGAIKMPYDDWTVQNDDDGYFYFGNDTDKITFTTESGDSDYKFIVTELKDSYQNVAEDAEDSDKDLKIVYSDAKFIATVSVKDNAQGKLVASDPVITPLIKDESGEHEGSSTKAITFINTPVDDTSIKFYARKVLIGSDGEPLTEKELKSNKFTFELKNENGEVLQTKTNGTNNGTASDSSLITFDPIEYSLTDLGGAESREIKYYINEFIPNDVTKNKNGKYEKDGYIFDDTVYEINVRLYLDNKELKADADRAIVEKPEITFHNTYHKVVKYELDGYKEITGRDYNDKDEFYAKLNVVKGRKNESGTLDKVRMYKKALQLPSWLTGKFAYGYFEFENKDEKYFVFDETDINKTYVYQVVEEGEVENVTNDTTLYRVELSISENDREELVVTDKIIPVDTQTGYEKSPVKHITFVNHYNAEGTTYFEASKELVNKELSNDNQFTFILEDMDGTEIASAKNNGANVTLRNDEKLKYDQDDVGKEFYYRIYEKAEKKAGYEYSEAVYIVKAEPKYDENYKIVVDNTYYSTRYEGKEKSEITVDDIIAEVPAATVKFINTYTAEGSVKMWAYKKLIGKDLTDNEFKFILKDEKGKTLSEAYSKAGSAGKEVKSEFEEIKFTQADLKADGTHYDAENDIYTRYYTIEEYIPKKEGAVLKDGVWTKDGYTYDNSVYNVVVTLEDKDGKIVTDWYAYKEGMTPKDPSFWDKVVGFVTGKGVQKDAIFTNEYAAEGAIDLSAMKVLTGKELKAGDFSFILTDLKDKSTQKKENAADGSVVFDRIRYTKAGDYKYTIKEDIDTRAKKDKDGFMVFDGVRYDTTEYTIEVEVRDNDYNGKLSVSAKIDGAPAATSAVVKDGDKVLSLCKPAAVNFRNEYDCEPVSVPLYGTKKLTGRNLEDGEFFFRIESAEGNPKYADKYEEVVSNIGDKFTFTSIGFEFKDLETAPGSGKYEDSRKFGYTVTEVIPADDKKLNGVTYNPTGTVYNVVITVTNNKGVLDAKVTSNDMEVNGGYIGEFINTYDAAGTITFPVKKEVQGTNDPKKVFYFELTGDLLPDASGVTPEKLTATATAVKPGAFATIRYTLDDLNENADGTRSRTFKYTVVEVDPGIDDGYDYSEVVYEAEVEVKSNGKSDKLDITSKIKKNGKPYDDVEGMKFVNPYSAKGGIDIPGIKYLEGRDLEKEKFTFFLEEKGADGQYTKVAETNNDPKTGEFNFHLDYTEEDIKGSPFVYRVREDIPEDAAARKDIDFDGTVYDVTVTVDDDNKNGKLNVAKEILNGSNVVDKCIFTNKVVKPNSVQFIAEKTLIGKPLANEMFTFTLEGMNNDEHQNVKNQGQKVTFKAIDYKLSDAGKTFKYKISEDIVDSSTGIKRDEAVYTADVKVTNVNGVLQTETTLKKDGTVVTTTKDGIISDIKFENWYSSSTSVQFGGHKILKGFEDDATPLGTYSFQLLDKDGNVLQEKTVTPKKATDKTEYKFDPITYDQTMFDGSETKKIYTYTVVEKIPQQKAANVEYATNKYEITVELYYNAEGLIEAKASEKSGASVTDGLDFTNKYAADGDVYFDGVKTITGKELGVYTFTLTGDGQDQSVQNNGSVFTFNKIHFAQKDIGHTYKYEIKESLKTGDGSTPDPTVYEAVVTVGEGNDGKLDITKVITKKSPDGSTSVLGEGEKITFNNKFEAKGSIGLEGKKIMHNKPLRSGDFYFVLKDENGKVLQKVTSGSSPLKSKKDLTAESAFEFKDVAFTQEDLKASDGSYLKEVKKYYTIEEERGSKGGVTYGNEYYIVEVTIANNGTEDLVVSRKIKAANKPDDSNSRNSLVNSIKLLFGGADNDEVVFENYYDSECIIDPPILRKQIMGKKIERGEFKFKVEGPGLPSMGEEKYERTILNGINSADGSKYYPDGSEIDPGEIYVGDIKYKYNDLDIDLETGAASGEFVYIATEIPGDDKAIDYSPQKFKLTIKVIDNDEGGLYTEPEIKDMKWEPLTDYRLSDEQMADTFLNIFNQEGSINLTGIKKLTGRALTKDDKFEFTLTDDATGVSVIRENTEDENGIPRLVEFNAKDKDGNTDIEFLNYRYGAYEVNPDREEGEPAEFEAVDDTGIHTYTIVENSIDKEGIKYDTAIFKVYVDVQPAIKDDGSYEYNKNGHGLLNATVTKVEKIYSDNNKTGFDFAGNNVFEFTNNFKATGKLEFKGTKYLSGQDGKDAGISESLRDLYGFALYQYDDASRTTGKTLVDTKKTEDDGSFTLDVPEYDQEVLKNEKGEYEESKTLYYRIIETKPSEGQWINNNTVFESNGVVYDNTEYDVDVTVTYDGSNALKVDKVIRDAETGEEVTNISFTNIQNKEYVTIPVKKHWIHNDKELTAGELGNVPDLTFNLYSSAVGGGKEIINTYVLKSGQLTFTFKTDKADEELPKYDANGKLIVYTVEEVPVPGYLSEKKEYDFYNTDGDIKIQKIAADTNEPLAGATLAIYDGSKEVEKWTSGNSAYVVKADLTPGKTYILRELEAPKGYEVAADVSFTVPSNGSEITVTMTDKPIIGTVRLTKRDSSTRDALTGAEFALYSQAGTRIYATGTAGRYRATSATSNGVFTTDSAGVLEITNLPYGAYYFVETKAPEGYVLSSEKLGFTIANGGETVEVTCLNKESLGAVRLRKVSATGERTLAGAVFELYAATPRSAAQAVSSTIYRDAYYRYGTYTTNSSGEIYVGDLPWDDYYFVEVKAPDGYEIAKDLTGDTLVYTFTIDGSNAGTTVDLGDIVNNATSGVLGERRPPEEEKSSGVLGVRSTPKKGVLGSRVVPPTGDVSAIALWLTVMLACIGTIVWVLVDGRKKRARG